MGSKGKSGDKGQAVAAGSATSAAQQDGAEIPMARMVAFGGEGGAVGVLGVEVATIAKKAKRGGREPRPVAVPPKEPLPPMPAELKEMLATRQPGKVYSDEVKSAILEHIFCGIASRLTISDMCKQEGMPEPSAIYRWILANSDTRENYTAARRMRADSRADRIDEITDMALRGEIDAQVARVAIDAERWQASKENQQYYGDRVQVDGDNSPAAVLDALSGLVKAISGGSRSLLPVDNPAPLLVSVENDSGSNANL